VNGLDAAGAAKAFVAGAKGFAAKAFRASPGFTNGLDAAAKPVEPPAFKKGFVAAASGFLLAMKGLEATSGAFITGATSFFGSSFASFFGLELMKLIEDPPETGLLSFESTGLNSNLINASFSFFGLGVLSL
jgi:hypothetical protein